MKISVPLTACNIEAAKNGKDWYLKYNRHCRIVVGCPFEIEFICRYNGMLYVVIRKYTMEEYENL